MPDRSRPFLALYCPLLLAGGAIQTGSVRQLTGGAKSIGKPPADSNKDWVAIIKRDSK